MCCVSLLDNRQGRPVFRLGFLPAEAALCQLRLSPMLLTLTIPQHVKLGPQTPIQQFPLLGSASAPDSKERKDEPGQNSKDDGTGKISRIMLAILTGV